MNHLDQQIVEDETEVASDLAAIGLSAEVVTDIALAAAGAKAEALPVDPNGAPGQLSYIYGVRQKRLRLEPLGWKRSKVFNVESTVEHDLGIQLCFQNVDKACNKHRDPRAISKKGPASRRIVHDGQPDLFDLMPEVGKSSHGAIPTVWVICVSSDDDSIQVEVSCPKAFDGDEYQGFHKRIFVLDMSFDNGADPSKSDDEFNVDDDYDVDVSRKS